MLQCNICNGQALKGRLRYPDPNLLMTTLILLIRVQSPYLSWGKGQKENKDVCKCGYAPICEKCYIELLHLFICFFFAVGVFKGNIFHMYIFGEFCCFCMNCPELP